MTSLTRKFVAPLLLLLGGFALAPAVQAKGEWVRLGSDNFELVGNADRKQLREIASKLEQFRASFTQLLPNLHCTRQVPTTIMVFNSMRGYGPFRPSNSAGHFVPGPDANFIVLTTELGSTQDAYSVIFHEYTHLLLNHSDWRDIPTWLNEGLAEYYSTFATSGQDRVMVGAQIPAHLYHLRHEPMLPLELLFAVDNKSPYYNEQNKQSIFYAQAWLLVHYLMQTGGGARRTELLRFVDSLLAGTTVEPAFQAAFGMRLGEMQTLLTTYAQTIDPNRPTDSFRNQLASSKNYPFEPLGEAEVTAYQGDLALHMHLTDAKSYLERSLQLDPTQPRALAALGLWYSDAGEFTRARPLLERAVAAGADNFYVNFRYAEAWLRESEADPLCLTGIPAERIARMRASLKTAIAANPDHFDSYRLLAYVSLLNDQDLDETSSMLEQVLARAPDRFELSFMLGQLYLRKHRLAQARAVLELVTEKGGTAELRDRAQQVLIVVAQAEADERRPVEKAAEQAVVPVSTGETDDRGEPARAVLALRPIKDGELRVRGSLTQIECAGGRSVVLVVRAGERTYRLIGANLNEIRFATFTSDQASGANISCGPLNATNTVLATYRPATAGARRIDGDAIAIEFIPAETVLH
jgi:tetratricopeptide (TPR) repeat protein